MTIKRARFVQDAKLDPGRFYRNPSDIIRDRRLTKTDRLEIVMAWEQRIAGQTDDGAEERLTQLRKLREEIEQDLESAGAPKPN